ncbi:hypothetical protein RND81_08G064200 [Saponaria officinalis]|uniref:Ycf20 n=1 Tax=Saponaria officinalis TaxID=3572 RepID=A0AAW1J350_SAPOF
MFSPNVVGTRNCPPSSGYKHLWAARGAVAGNAWPRSEGIYGRSSGRTATLQIEETTHYMILMQVRPERHLALSERCETDKRNGNAPLVSDKWEIVGIDVELLGLPWYWLLELGYLSIQQMQGLCPQSFRRLDWSIKSSADGRGLDPLVDSSDERTRLLKTFKNLQRRLNARIQELRKDLPKKPIFFLVGFYCATAFATFIRKTSDWDILSAGVAVAMVEGIRALMYKLWLPSFKRARGVIVLFNYWKTGLKLGLFMDSLKY